MKKYIVKWKKEEKEFDDVSKAIGFAEEVGESGYTSSVWTEIDGVRDAEPFFYTEWEI